MKTIFAFLLAALVLVGCTCEGDKPCDQDLSVQKQPPMPKEVEWQWNGREFVEVR